MVWLSFVTLWWQTGLLKRPPLLTLVINQDPDPENNSSQTQFRKRLVAVAPTPQLEVQLASYPPSPSKYNPSQRVWAGLEPQWNGSLHDAVDTAVPLAKTLTGKGQHPVVTVVTKTSQTGVKLTKVALAVGESQLERFAGLDKGFIKIAGPTDS